jgi:hypothetical protein
MTTIKERFNRILFQNSAKYITKTPSTPRGNNLFTALTMVHERDVIQYLLAIKTFAHYARPERIILIADPSLENRSKSLIKAHVPHIEIIDATKFRRPALPIGGTWERLSAISVLSEESPIVQLDADTLTLDFPGEVVRCMDENTSFIMRSEDGVEMQTLDEASLNGRIAVESSTHIQALAEANLANLPNSEYSYYVRGCSGFTGFSKGALSPKRLDRLSQAMYNLLDTKWNKWGSEQVSSNLLAASSPNALLLPYPKYCNADSLCKETTVAHFIGYTRYTSRDYEYSAKKSILMLSNQK